MMAAASGAAMLEVVVRATGRRRPSGGTAFLFAGPLAALATAALAIAAAAGWASAQGGAPPAERKGEPAAIQGWGAAVTPRRPGAGGAGASPGAAAGPLPAGPYARTAEISLDEGRTRLTLTLSEPVEFQVYTLDNPYRVVIDAANLAFALPALAGQKGAGLIASYRYGLLAPGKSRIVLAATGPMRVEAAQLMTAGPEGPHWLVLDLLPVAADAFTRMPLPEIGGPDTPPPKAERKGARHVIVLDPGHGGIDPGATGAVVREKDVVLAVALRVKALLAANADYDVHVTRGSDTFIALDERVRISRELEAALFISIHADSIAETRLAQAIRGASVYTLSERASNEVARRLAEKENASDLVAGLDAARPEEKDQVPGFLLDLMRRETASLSAKLSSHVVANLRRSVTVAREPARSAAFKVLQQPQSPSVLIELGYMSNVRDEELLRSAAWQNRVAAAIARAVDDYFVTPGVAGRP